MSGFRILDLTANMSGPLATMILGDQGADVIKIESGAGDPLRYLGSGNERYAAFYANLNRSKRSLLLDLTKRDARPIFDALLDRADVVVHNFRPDAAARLQIDAPSVRSSRRRLIHVTVSGFGPATQFKDRRAYDHVIQAVSGFAALQGDPRTEEPELVRQGVVDKLTAQYAAQAITAALLERTRTGTGRVLDVSMLDAAVAFLWPDGMMDFTAVAPEFRRPSVRRTFRLTQTSDGHLAFIVMIGEQYNQLARALGIDPGLVDDGAAFLREAARRLGKHSTKEAVALLASADIPVAPVAPLELLHEQPEIMSAGSIDEFEHPVLGRARQANPAARFNGERASTLRPAPLLGQHTHEICNEIGLDPERIQHLEREGVLR